MSADGEINDPVFGVLHVADKTDQCTTFRGEVNFTPKHRVVIDFQYFQEMGSLAVSLGVGRDVYARVRRGEWSCRLQVAQVVFDEVLPDIVQFLDEGEWTEERVARSLTLRRIDLRPDCSGWFLHYDSDGKFNDGWIYAYFSNAGTLEEIEFD
jgi:hypothetical protein